MDSNNIQINTFSGGMNTDTSDALLSNTQYRFAENLRYVTETDSNTGELHLIPGAKHLITITNELDTSGSKIIGTAVLRDLGICIVDTYIEGGPGWTVCTFNNADDLSGVHKKIKIVFSTNDTSRVFNKKLSLVTKYEDYDNLKLYIADGCGPIITILLATEDCLITNNASIVSAYPSVEFSPIEFRGLTTGQIKPGVVQYSYQLYNKYGQQSEISPVTELIPIVNGKTGYLQTDVTNKGVLLTATISNNISFDHIRVFRILYQQSGQLPIITVVYDEKILSQQNAEDVVIDITDNGQIDLGTLTVEEYNSITGIHIIPKTIESKDEYLFAANIQDKSDEFDILLKDYDFSAPQINNAARADGAIVSWQFVAPEDGVEIDANLNNDRINDTSYGSLNTPFMKKSLRRDEIYRYGIVLYNSIGEASSVKWIADIHTPTMQVSNTFEIDTRTGKLYSYPLGVRFKVNTSTFAQVGIKAYEIVRCKREFEDIYTISQGVVSKPINRPTLIENGSVKFPATPWMPTGLITNAEYKEGTSSEFAHTAFDGKSPYLFISPEASYNEDSILYVKNNKTLLLKPAIYVYPYNSAYLAPSVGGVASVYNIGNDYSNFSIISNGGLPGSLRYSTLSNNYFYPTIRMSMFPGATLTLSDLEYLYKKSSEIKNGVLFSGSMYNRDARYSYIKLYNKRSIDHLGNYITDLHVNSIQLSESLSYKDYADTTESHNFIFKDKIQAVGQYTYLNWVIGSGYRKNWNELTYWREMYDDETYNVLLGPAGKCALLDVDETWMCKFATGNLIQTTIGTIICNLRKNAVPYGGDSDAAKKLSVYKSFGNYFVVGNDSEQTHDVYDGDCYILPFEYTSLHKWTHPEAQYPTNACITYSIPLETNINLFATSGFELSKNLDHNSTSDDISYIQEEPANVNNKLIQDKPLYVYNTAYSISDSPRIFAADDSEYDITNQDYRVYHSLLKSNNEYIDSWLKFQPANYIDTDTRLGLITGLRRFKNQLVFWQENATGVLSVNERSLITDHDKMPLILGSGDVLSRYDYITTSNGMKVDQYADAQSESTLYWWDYVRKELCAYQSGQGYNILSKSKFVLNYINKHVNIETPALIFDKQYNELIASVVNDESLVYNELIGNFISVYKIHPLYHIQFSDKLLLMNNNSADVFQWNKVQHDGVSIGMDSMANGLLPKIEYVVNKGADTTKVFDNGEIAGRFYGGDDLKNIKMSFKTPLKQHGELSGEHISNREYNFRYVIPRHDDAEVGNRLRGKFMQCTLRSEDNSLDFSLQYIMTKFRVSWS